MSDHIITTKHGLVFNIDTDGLTEAESNAAVEHAWTALNRLSPITALSYWAAAKLDGTSKAFEPSHPVVGRVRDLGARITRAATRHSQCDGYVSIGALELDD